MVEKLTKDKTIGQLGALLIGFAYLGGGVTGLFFTGFSGFVDAHGTVLFGLFAINPFHNIVHIGVGGLLILASTARSSSMAEGALLGVGAIYVVATVTGFIYAHIPVIALTTSTDPDNYLHLVTGLTAITVAVLSASTNKATLATR